MYCLSLESCEDWETVISKKEVEPLCVHLLGNSPNIEKNLNLIHNLLFSYADSETKDKTIFVLDADRKTFEKLYKRFNSCVDRYFRVVYYSALKE